MNDAKSNYAAMAESEFDLRREAERLRDINKDLLEACEASLWAVNAAECLGEKEGIGKDTTKYTERIKLDAIVERVRAAIAKAEGK